jgi:hypothetical protein
VRELKLQWRSESLWGGLTRTHRDVERIVHEHAAPAYDHQWVSQFQDLHKLVEQHVAAEENEMFRRTQAVMTPQGAEELGGTVETAKQDISRNAPTTEGGTPEQT